MPWAQTSPDDPILARPAMITRPLTAQTTGQFIVQFMAQVDGRRDGRGEPSSGSPSQIVRTSLACRPLDASAPCQSTATRF
jgi:hypothetical protein